MIYVIKQNGVFTSQLNILTRLTCIFCSYFMIEVNFLECFWSERWKKKRRKVPLKEAESLTDLFSWSFPAESHLSEPLPAVRGLERPDKTAEKTSSSGRCSQRKWLCVCSTHTPTHKHTHLSFVLECVCSDMSNVV